MSGCQSRQLLKYSFSVFEDPLDSILRRQLPGQTRYSESCDSNADSERPVPTKSEEERLPTRRMRRPPQRYSPPINTEPVPGPSRLPTGTDRTVRRGRPKKDPPPERQPARRGRPRKDPSSQTSTRTKKRTSLKEYADGLWSSTNTNNCGTEKREKTPQK